jgi:hypothetical protein
MRVMLVVLVAAVVVVALYGIYCATLLLSAWSAF